jgi:hypothetical protein
LVLPARDIFSEEIRILIQNVDIQSGNAFLRKRHADIRIYSSTENVELSRTLLDNELVIMHEITA